MVNTTMPILGSFVTQYFGSHTKVLGCVLN